MCLGGKNPMSHEIREKFTQTVFILIIFVIILLIVIIFFICKYSLLKTKFNWGCPTQKKPTPKWEFEVKWVFGVGHPLNWTEEEIEN